jgi:hypothetical protein
VGIVLVDPRLVAQYKEKEKIDVWFKRKQLFCAESPRGCVSSLGVKVRLSSTLALLHRAPL